MADENTSASPRLVETHERADGSKPREPISPRDIVIGRFREAYQAGQSIEGIGDAMKMGGVVVAAFLTLMSLATASSAGVSAFISGVVVGAVAGAVLVIWCSNGGSRTAVSHHASQGKHSAL